jgi:phosphate transport system substrate-binding protein
VLGKDRDFKLGSNDLHGSKDVVDAVEKTPCGIGYSGLAYATDNVQLASVAKDENGPYVAPSVSAAVEGSYPIARPLLMYTNGEPKGAVKAYMDWIMSDEGQRVIQAKGYAPYRKLSGE